MEILIFSDSHGRTAGMERAIHKQIKRPDLIVHLGDGAGDLEYLGGVRAPVLSVRGNCDLFTVSQQVPEERTLEEMGHKLLILHGHRYFVKESLSALIVHAAQIGADIVLYGHTHVPHEERLDAGSEIGGVTLERPMYLFNPGSIGRNADGNGVSFGTLSLTARDVLFSHGRIRV